MLSHCTSKFPHQYAIMNTWHKSTVVILLLYELKFSRTVIFPRFWPGAVHSRRLVNFAILTDVVITINRHKLKWTNLSRGFDLAKFAKIKPSARNFSSYSK